MPTVSVSGNFYHPQTGLKVTTGKLYLTPRTFVVYEDSLVAPLTMEVSYDAVAGNWNFQVVPSNGVDFIVEYDPDPADTATPRKLKPGFWRNVWSIPSTGPVNLEDL